MNDDSHKAGLYRWKRQEDPRSYSRDRKVATTNDIQNWINKVEEASNRATEHVFRTNHSSGRARGKAVARAAREYTHDDEQAYSEAQDLLSQWMEEKVNLHGNLEPEIDSHYDDESWQNHELQSDVKREWDNMLANNLEDYGLTDSYGQEHRSTRDMYNVDEDDAVASVMKTMMDRQVVKKGFKTDLGLDKWGKQKDPRNKMELRHKQVKENRERKEEELRKKQELQRNKKEATVRAKQLVMREERVKELQTRKEEMNIRKEMTKIRKEMQDERKREQEKKSREKQAREEATLAARVKVAWEEEAEEVMKIEEEQRHEERQRTLAQRMVELEKREAANNLKILHRHFSAWYNVILERRMKIGKARAMSDWKLLLRAWNAWRSFVRGRRLARENVQHQQEVIHTQRNHQVAERHNKQKLLRKYFLAWQVWAQSERDRRELEHAQKNTRNKMMSLLEKAATGKLWQQEEGETSEGGASSRSSARLSAREQKGQRKEKLSTAQKIDALFHNTRNIPPVTDSMLSERTEVSMETDSGGGTGIPTEPWQITRKHLNLSPQEIASLGGGEPTCSPEEMNAKVLKKYGRQAWHKQEVSTYEHRHATQKKILQEQKRQIMEQQRKIEELQFASTHSALQKQLLEQKLVLKDIEANIENPVDTVIQGNTNNNNSSVNNVTNGDRRKLNDNQMNKMVVKSSNQSSAKSSRKDGMQTTQKSGPRPKSAVAGQKRAGNGMDTSRSGAAMTNRPSSARTETSQATSWTSTATEKGKYLQVLRNMEDRTAERARAKTEREEKRRKAEEDRLMELEAIEEARKKEEEEEKRAKVEAYREKKRQEKQREVERQIRDEKLRRQTEMADVHYQRSLLKYRGLGAFRKLVTMAREQNKMAIQHHQHCLLRKVLVSWHHYVKDQWREKEALASEMNNFLCVKHCFQSWRYYKHHMVIQEHKAARHYATTVKSKLFQVWRDYANEEKVASWEKDRKAREHYRKLLLKRHFNAWIRLPDEIEREKERERRRAELREKVASILPDFEVSASLEKSADFHL